MVRRCATLVILDFKRINLLYDNLHTYEHNGNHRCPLLIKLSIVGLRGSTDLMKTVYIPKIKFYIGSTKVLFYSNCKYMEFLY
jgi:hypothetical protein